jgi:hypothetical protein
MEDRIGGRERYEEKEWSMIAAEEGGKKKRWEWEKRKEKKETGRMAGRWGKKED